MAISPQNNERKKEVCYTGELYGLTGMGLYVGSLERGFLRWEFVGWITSKGVPTLGVCRLGHFKEGSYAGSL